MPRRNRRPAHASAGGELRDHPVEAHRALRFEARIRGEQALRRVVAEEVGASAVGDEEEEVVCVWACGCVGVWG
jgi:hypothetical protein